MIDEGRGARRGGGWLALMGGVGFIFRVAGSMPGQKREHPEAKRLRMETGT